MLWSSFVLFLCCLCSNKSCIFFLMPIEAGCCSRDLLKVTNHNFSCKRQTHNCYSTRKTILCILWLYYTDYWSINSSEFYESVTNEASSQHQRSIWPARHWSCLLTNTCSWISKFESIATFSASQFWHFWICKCWCGILFPVDTDLGELISYFFGV